MLKIVKRTEKPDFMTQYIGRKFREKRHPVVYTIGRLGNRILCSWEKEGRIHQKGEESVSFNEAVKEISTGGWIFYD